MVERGTHAGGVDGGGGGGGGCGGVGAEGQGIRMCGCTMVLIWERRSWSKVGMRVNGEVLDGLFREWERKRWDRRGVFAQSEGESVVRLVRARWTRSCNKPRREIARCCERRK